MDHYHLASQNLNTNLARYPVLAVGLPLIGGFLSAVPSHRHIRGYYESLQKPDWAPPSYAFAPAWTALYLSVGYASHLVARCAGLDTYPTIRSAAQTGLGIYGVNMLLNFAWSPLMFWHKKIGAALVTAGGLTASSVAMAYYFFQVDTTAGYLTIPYVAWLGYATALNYDVWIKNSSGSAAEHARRIGKDVNDAANHAKTGAQDAARHAKHGAKDAARNANRSAKNAADEAADEIDRKLR
ncbi:translocator protein [Entomortierella parvispora]|uniref:Translocator protein n=1 Tax=Entomortierella parvispora TaxID=205924 RepID=A0A9P3H8F6_9FUNG|nr:translocator protein [Entomortierella parvispora]